ncbi:retroviral-like aspartic protease family protein [Luteibacter sp. RCC_6_2]|uniref:retroviral-like aspartic protease family protein n=1 Tax=Luteibacter sp. RCC_6_2 TaxID=3239223 RepID=UPI003524CFFD
MVIALLLMSGWVHADKVVYIKLGSESPLMQMAVQGNSEALDAYALRSPGPIPRLFAEAAAARARFDIAGSDKNAAECYAKAQALHPPAVDFMIACGELRVGNAVLAGRFADWSAEAARVRREAYPQLPKNPGIELRVASLEAPDVSVFAGMPAPTSSRSVDTGIIPSGNGDPGALHGVLSVKTKANGMPLAMAVDTGTQITVLSRVDAEQVKAKQVPATVMQVASTQAAKGVEVKAAQLESLELGGFRLNHANVGVWDLPFSVLGLDVLAQLPDPIRISDRGVAFGGGKLPGACSGRLFLRSELGARPAYLLITGTVDGAPKEFMVDTGSNSAVSRRAQAGDAPGKLIDVMTISGPSKLHSSFASQSVGIGAAPTRVDVRVVSGEAAQDLTVGNGFFSFGRTLWLSFAQQKGCVLPNGEGQ